MSDAASTNSQPTPAAEWKAAYRTLVTLPSAQRMRACVSPTCPAYFAWMATTVPTTRPTLRRRSPWTSR